MINYLEKVGGERVDAAGDGFEGFHLRGDWTSVRVCHVPRDDTQ